MGSQQSGNTSDLSTHLVCAWSTGKGPVGTCHGHRSSQHGGRGHLVATALAQLLRGPAAGEGDVPEVQGALQPLPPSLHLPQRVPAPTEGLGTARHTTALPQRGEGVSEGQADSGRNTAPAELCTTGHGSSPSLSALSTQPMARPPSVPAQGPALLPGVQVPSALPQPCPQTSRTASPRLRACPSERPALRQQQSMPATMPLLCRHSSAREQPSALRQSRMFSARAAQQLAEVPAISQLRLSWLLLGDCGVPKGLADLPEQHRARHLLASSGPECHRMTAAPRGRQMRTRASHPSQIFQRCLHPVLCFEVWQNPRKGSNRDTAPKSSNKHSIWRASP